ncbi:unnamed protein product [Schistosoma mattheei]|uniref:Uncharacterized protein n=1 Tax=Schistosoma mattheei TaxID=31246 RepID=A0A183PCJ2_9TREM|nr:unnamed protein product [Schistosoma mattheei]
MFAVASMSNFSASYGVLSGPAAFPLLFRLMSTMDPTVVGGLRTIEKSVDADSMSDGFNAADLFNSSSNNNTPLFLSP